MCPVAGWALGLFLGPFFRGRAGLFTTQCSLVRGVGPSYALCGSNFVRLDGLYGVVRVRHGTSSFSRFVCRVMSCSPDFCRLLAAYAGRQDGRAVNNITWTRFVKGHFFLQAPTTVGGKCAKSLLTSRYIFRPGALFFLFSSGTLGSAQTLKPLH